MIFQSWCLFRFFFPGYSAVALLVVNLHSKVIRGITAPVRLMPIGLPAATWMVKIGAPLVMRTDPELGLYGRYCVSKRLKEEGFNFSFPDLTTALQNLYNS